ncbi:MAG: class I SAM-dependent methyltransferase [Butyricicoccaceae bacterium]
MTEREYEQLLNIATTGVQTDDKDTYYEHRYEPTEYRVLELIRSAELVHSHDCVVDYGCGKGRLGFFLSHFLGCQTKGIEKNERYFRAAEQNRYAYQQKYGKNDRITFIQCDALQYPIQREDSCFYFFNPFSIEIFRTVIWRIEEAVERQGIAPTLLLYYPAQEYLDFLEEQTCFSLESQWQTNPESKDPRDVLLVYRIEH